MDKYDYDIDVDAFTLRKHEFDYAYSIDVTSEIILDLDCNKNLIGIEILDASKVLDIDPALLVKPKRIFAKVVSTDGGLSLTMKFEFNNITHEMDIPLVNVVSSGNSLVIDA